MKTVRCTCGHEFDSAETQICPQCGVLAPSDRSDAAPTFGEELSPDEYELAPDEYELSVNETEAQSDGLAASFDLDADDNEEAYDLTDSGADGVRISCPNCRAPVEESAVLCVACGLNLQTGEQMPGLAAAASEAEPTKAARRKSKPKLKQPATEANPDTGSRFPQIPRWAILAGVGSLAVLAIVGVLFFTGGDPPSRRTAGAAPATPPPPPAPPAADLVGETSTDFAGRPSDVEITVGRYTIRRRRQFDGHTAPVSQLVFAPQGARAVTVDQQGDLRVRNLQTGETVQTLRGVRGPVVFTPDGQQLLLPKGRGQLELVDVALGETLKTFATASKGDWAIAISADGQQAIAGGLDGPLSRLDLTSGSVTPLELELPAQATAVGFNSDGSLAVVGDAEGRLTVWDLDARAQRAKLPGQLTAIRQIAISPDGRWALSSAGGHEFRQQDRRLIYRHARVTDLALRVWNLDTHTEQSRFRTYASQPIQRLAFTDLGRRAMFVTDRVTIVDLTTGARLLSLAMPDQATTADLPLVAALSPQGNGLLTAVGQAVEYWELPELETPEAAATDVPGRRALPPLAGLARPTWSQPPGPGLDTWTKRIWKQSLDAKPGLRSLWPQLKRHAKTSDQLMKVARYAVGQKMYLEAEECLRAVLAVAPETPKAQTVYDKLAERPEAPPSRLTVEQPFAEPVASLRDGIGTVTPPDGQTLVSVMLRVQVADQPVRLGSKSLTGQANRQAAEFLGIYCKPTGEIKGLARNAQAGRPEAQLWEMLTARPRSRKPPIVRLQNRQRPMRPRAVRGRPAGNIEPQPDKTYFETTEDAAYQAIFAVPIGTTLTEIQLADEPPIALLSAPVESPQAELERSSLARGLRLKLIEQLGSEDGPAALGLLNEFLANSQNERELLSARDAERRLRRQLGLLGAIYTPAPSTPGGNLVACTVLNAPPAVPATSHRGRTGARAEQAKAKLRSTWLLTSAGQYQVRILAFGPGDENYRFEFGQTVGCKIVAPGLYTWALPLADLPSSALHLLVELWSDGRLLERRLLTSDADAAAVIARHVSLTPPATDTQPTAERRRRLASRRRGRQSSTSTEQIAALLRAPATPVTPIDVLRGAERDLPLLLRGVRHDLTRSLDSSESTRLVMALGEVCRLEQLDQQAMDQAVARLIELLGEYAPSVFARLLEDGPHSVRAGALAGLARTASTSREACQALIRGQKLGTAPVVEQLIQAGTLRQEGDQFLFQNKPLLDF